MFRAVGCHCFAGGVSLGVEQHVTIAAHLESGRLGIETWCRNRPGVPVINDRDGAWSGALAEIRRAGRPNLVYGNPDCSAFSRLNMVPRGVDRAALSKKTRGIEQVVRVGARLEARVIVVESVRDAMTKGRPLFAALWDEVRDQYPAAMWVLVNAQRHGVCQDRPRLFWVLAPERFELDLKPMAPPALLDALAGIPAAAPNQERLDLLVYAEDFKYGAAALLPYLQPGQSINDLPHELLATHAPVLLERVLRRRTHIAQWATRLRADRLARVVDRNLKWVHPTEDRLLSAREMARLMGFPDDFAFAGGPASWLGQIGRGVCPPVGEWIANEVAAYLHGQRAGYGPGPAIVDPHARTIQLGLF
jgi:DNA (cytosine-5)-methyltransferase 1